MAGDTASAKADTAKPLFIPLDFIPLLLEMHERCEHIPISSSTANWNCTKKKAAFL